MPTAPSSSTEPTAHRSSRSAADYDDYDDQDDQSGTEVDTGPDCDSFRTSAPPPSHAEMIAAGWPITRAASRRLTLRTLAARATPARAGAAHR